MPRVWRGRRRWLLASLVALGVAQAGLALAMAFSVDGLLSGISAVATSATDATADPTPDWWSLGILVGSVLGIGLARWYERILAEDLGQDYVYEQRRRLVASALGEIGNRSLGVIVTRASNDLTAVRNWIAQGIVPLVTALPLIGVVLAVLAITNWPVAVAVAVPLAIMALLLPWLSRIAHDRARTVRRYRGRMSAHIADTVQAGQSIRISGAMQRELNALDRNSGKVVDAAVHRAQITGFIRALTITAGSLCTVAVVFLAMIGRIDVAEVASIMTLLGVMATPLADLGRVVEYRQNFRAAKRILAPMLAEARELKRAERKRERAWQAEKPTPKADRAGIEVRNFEVTGIRIPELVARPGERIQLCSEHPSHIREVVSDLFDSYDLEAVRESTSEVLVNGLDFRIAPARERRNLVGLASDALPLERGSVQRLVSYRHPNATIGEIKWMLRHVGLEETVERSPKGLSTKLKNDGAPWGPEEVALLKVARAALGTPPVLVLEHIDAALDTERIEQLGAALREYPGVILFASHQPDLLFERYGKWELDGTSEQDRAFTATMIGRSQTAHREFKLVPDEE